MTHTPTPWVLFESDNNTNIVSISEYGTQLVLGLGLYSKNEPDLKFIIKAVNSHDDLVAVLKRVYNEIQLKSYPDISVKKDAIHSEIIFQVEAALAKAKGEKQCQN